MWKSTDKYYEHYTSSQNSIYALLKITNSTNWYIIIITTANMNKFFNCLKAYI